MANCKFATKKYGDFALISKHDIKSMPITFIVSPIVFASLLGLLFLYYGDMMEEKEYIVGLSCPELKQYADEQIIESKKYFGNEAFLIYAEERYSNHC
ncbi:MAG: hypothetical protein GTN35_01905 [Nitrososphaeria archaeon]|nr:hypothetical protein [Nitrosopumilaceae archaeon]NIP09275.1 hypothetical protein [Nitrosopumilaceae archaeon]NIP91149.1 hypothetical protein [Nitrososphaeria archaeon]NIS94443.1 hypothetical protein [Nitrosopumilaceae archaeon]